LPEEKECVRNLFTARGGELVHLVFLVFLVCLVGERNKPDKPEQLNKQKQPVYPLAFLPYALLFMPSLHTLPYYSLRRSMHDEGMDPAHLKK
jgi:hypothetical protein